MKKILFSTLFLLLFAFSQAALANETLLGNCIKEYQIKSGDLYLKTLSAIYDNKFEVSEMQSKNGLILFRAGRYEYLATVFITKNGSGVKILPANSDFSTGVGVQSSIFATLDEMLGQK